jgi:hypothetical protein
MADETRSLWKIYDSETAPWRRGRAVLVWIGLFLFILQCLVVTAQVILGNIDALFIYGTLIVLFWLQFYFVWNSIPFARERPRMEGRSYVVELLAGR